MSDLANDLYREIRELETTIDALRLSLAEANATITATREVVAFITDRATTYDRLTKQPQNVSDTEWADKCATARTWAQAQALLDLVDGL